jgi:hypothetical protein
MRYSIALQRFHDQTDQGVRGSVHNKNPTQTYGEVRTN